MFHDSKELEAIVARRETIGTAAAVNAFCDICIESLSLQKKLIDNARALFLSAANPKDGREIARTMSVFMETSYRDVSENAEAAYGVWRRFLKDAASANRRAPLRD